MRFVRFYEESQAFRYAMSTEVVKRHREDPPAYSKNMVSFYFDDDDDYYYNCYYYYLFIILLFHYYAILPYLHMRNEMMVEPTGISEKIRAPDDP